MGKEEEFIEFMVEHRCVEHIVGVVGLSVRAEMGRLYLGECEDLLKLDHCER